MQGAVRGARAEDRGPSQRAELPSLTAGDCRQLLLVASNVYFAANAVVADSRQPADCLMIVSRGLVDTCLPMKEGGRVLCVLQRG